MSENSISIISKMPSNKQHTSVYFVVENRQLYLIVMRTNIAFFLISIQVIFLENRVNFFE